MTIFAADLAESLIRAYHNYSSLLDISVILIQLGNETIFKVTMPQ